MVPKGKVLVDPCSGSKNCHGPLGYKGIAGAYLIVIFTHQTATKDDDDANETKGTQDWGLRGGVVCLLAARKWQ